jgi:hypothetical protein
MFGTPNTRVTIVNFGGVRVKAEREQDPTHLVEISMECPFTPDLAEDISPALLRDSFNEAPKTEERWTPKPEISMTKFRLAPGNQRMTVRTHPELEPIVVVESVGLRQVTIKKQTKADVFMLSWVCSFALNAQAVVELITRVKASIYITFEKMQGELEFEEGDVRPDPTGAGNVVVKRGRGRPRKVRAQEEQPSLGSVESAPQEPPAQDFSDVEPSNVDASVGSEERE